jgi:hypothetical protein
MDRYDIMMPRLLPAEASKPRLYQPLLVTAGIILTCYGLLTAVSTLLPILRERIEANRAGSVTAFRDRIIVHSKPTVITMTPRPTLELPTAAAPTSQTAPQTQTLSGMPKQAVPVTRPAAGEPIPPTVGEPIPAKETVPQRSYTLSSTGRPAVPVSPGPIGVETIRPKLHTKATDSGWYIFVPPGDAQHKSANPSAPFARWIRGQPFGSARECERYLQRVVDDTIYERDHVKELSDPYDYKIELFSHAECVSEQDSRLTQAR